MSEILEKLVFIKERHDEVGKQIIDPDIIGDMKRYIKLNKEYKDLEPIVKAYHDYLNISANIESSKEIISNETDADFVQMAKEELDELEQNLKILEEEVKIMLIPKDPEDAKSAVVDPSITIASGK